MGDDELYPLVIKRGNQKPPVIDDVPHDPLFMGDVQNC